jgi:hypothetical protein
MGDLGDMFLGGSEPAGEPRIDQATTYTPEQNELLKKLTELMGGQMGQGVTAYPGDMTAGAAPLQTQAWDQISQLMAGGKSDASQTAVEKILAGSDVGEFDPTAIQDWYKNALVNPAMAEWESKTVPTIQEKFIGQNAGSSGAANRAISGSASDLMSDLNAQLASTLFGEKSAYDARKFEAGQNDLNRASYVPGMESTATTDFLKTLGIGAEAGTTQQALNQADINELITKWSAEQPYNNPWLSLLTTALGANSFENVVQPEVQKEGLLQTMIMPAFSSYMASDTGFSKK